MIKKCWMYCLAIIMLMPLYAVPVNAAGGLDGVELPAAVWEDIQLPPEDGAGNPITWTSGDSSVIDTDGTVTRPALMEDSVYVELTAQTASDSRTYSVFVPREALFGREVLREDFDSEADLAFRMDKGSFADGEAAFITEDGRSVMRVTKKTPDNANNARLTLNLPQPVGNSAEPVVDVRYGVKAGTRGNTMWMYGSNGSIISRITPHSSGSALILQYGTKGDSNIGETGTWLDLRQQFTFDATNGSTMSVWNGDSSRLQDVPIYSKNINVPGSDLSRLYMDMSYYANVQQVYNYYDYVIIGVGEDRDPADIVADTKAALDVPAQLDGSLSAEQGSARVEWVCSDPTRVEPDGTVHTPSGEEEITVDLTAVICCDGVVDTKSFPGVTIISGDLRAINEDIASVQIPEILKENLDIPETLPNGTTARLTSDVPGVLADDGTVTRPDDASAYVTFSIEYQYNDTVIVKDYSTIVPKTTPKSEMDGYFQDMEDITTETLANMGLTIAAASADYGTTTVETDPISGSNALVLRHAEEAGTYTPNINFNQARGLVNIEFDVRFDGQTNMLYIYGNGIVFSMTSNASNTVDVRLASGSQIVIQNGDPNHWYNIKIAMDFRPIDNGTGKSTFTMEVDGTPIGGTMSPRDNTQSYINRFLIGVGNPGDEIRYDNFKVYADSTEALQNAADSLDLGDTSAVLGDLTLPSSMGDGIKVEWISTDESYLTHDGKVTRPGKEQPAKTVQLYAVVHKNDTHTLRAFDVTIEPQYDDSKAVADDSAWLELEGLEAVRAGKLVLPSRGPNNTLITWSASDEAIISPTGTVNRPSYVEGARFVPVTLTATIAKGSEKATKTFTANVYRMNYAYQTSLYASSSQPEHTYLCMVDEDSETWWQPSEQGAATVQLDLGTPTFLTRLELLPRGNVGTVKLEYAKDNEWKSLPSPTLTDGVLAADFERIQARYIRATFSNLAADAGVYEIELFYVADRADVEADLAAIDFGSEYRTADLDLPESGDNGSKLVWKSETPELISDSGELYRPQNNQTGYLTATATKGNVTLSRSGIPVRIKGTSSGGSGGSGGGGVSHTGSGGGGTSGSNVALPSKPPVPDVPEPEEAFNDLGSVEWARDAIQTLYDKGIVNGRAEGQFAPNETVTRAELVKMMALALQLPDGDGAFADVPAEAWYAQPVYAAAAAGLVAGDGERFYPENAVTREDMAVILYRALERAGKAQEAAGDVPFADSAEIADYARSAVTALTEMGIMQGTGQGFEPKRSATRAETAKVLCAVLELLD